MLVGIIIAANQGYWVAHKNGEQVSPLLFN